LYTVDTTVLDELDRVLKNQDLLSENRQELLVKLKLICQFHLIPNDIARQEADLTIEDTVYGIWVYLGADNNRNEGCSAIMCIFTLINDQLHVLRTDGNYLGQANNYEQNLIFAKSRLQEAMEI